MHITVLGVWRLQESSIARSGTAREVCQASSAPVQLRSARFLSARLRSLRGTSVPEHLNASRKPQACPPSAMSVSQSDDSQSAGRRAIADAFQGYKKQFSEVCIGRERGNHHQNLTAGSQTRGSLSANAQVPDITPAELDSLRRSSATLTLIDVRTPEEQQARPISTVVAGSDLASCPCAGIHGWAQAGGAAAGRVLLACTLMTPAPH